MWVTSKETQYDLFITCSWTFVFCLEWTELSGREVRSRGEFKGSHFSDSGNCNYYHFKNHLQAMQCSYSIQIVTATVFDRTCNAILRVKKSLLDYWIYVVVAVATSQRNFVLNFFFRCPKRDLWGWSVGYGSKKPYSPFKPFLWSIYR